MDSRAGTLPMGGPSGTHDSVHLDEGVDVVVPDVPGSGRALISQGMIATAGRKARAVADALDPHLEAGRDVVAVEPSDLAMFRDEYDRLLPDARVVRLQAASYELFEYAFGLLENGVDADGLAAADGDETIAYHSHCQ
jgi:Fe-S oxidoreductase